MATTAAPVSRRALQARSIAEAFRITAEDFPDRVAVRTKDDEISLTWGELRERVDALAGGLAALGVQRGDTVALMLSNRPEFHLADLAVMSLGAVPFSIYLTSAPEQIAYVVRGRGREGRDRRGGVPREAARARAHRGARGRARRGHAGVGGRRGLQPGLRRRERVARGRARGPADADLHVGHHRAAEGRPARAPQPARGGREHRADDPVPRRREGHLVAAVGPHRRARGPPLPADRLRDDDHLAATTRARSSPTCRWSSRPGSSPCRGSGRSSRPGSRRCWRASRPSSASPPSARSAAARQKVELEQAGEPVPEELAAAVAKADAELFSGLRAMLGLDELEAVNVGAAPTPREVLVFFHAIGVEVAELWGMSETCGSGCCNPPGKVRIGTVGPPAPGVEIKLAEDGEVLMRSAVVMTGYRNLPERTAEALDADGWLHTGDIGEFDEEGYLRIVDRKKELIISAAGKNMSPANIESTLKGASPLIGQVCAIGDGRPYNTALIVLDTDFAPAWAAEQRPRGRVAGGAGDRRGDARGGAGGGRRRQRAARAGRADQEVHDRPGRLGAGRGRADADDEAQAQADRGEVRRRDRGDVPRSEGRGGHRARAGGARRGREPGRGGHQRAGPGHPPARRAVGLVGGAGVRRRLRGAGQAAVPLRRGDRQPGRHAGPVPRADRRASSRRSTRAGSRRWRRSRTRRRAGASSSAVAPRSSTRRRRRTSTGTSPRRPATRWWPAARPACRTRSASACSTRSGRRTGSPLGRRARRGRRGAAPTTRTASTVRMGLSPGGADIYTAQLERQWVDITGLDPGRVVVRGEANPLHCVLESNSANNDTQVTREIPGVRVADVSGGSSVSLSGVVVAPQVPARRSGGCVPGAGSKSCYVWASAAGPLRFSVDARAAPRHRRAGAGRRRAARRGHLHAGRGVLRRGLLQLRGDRPAGADLEAGNGARDGDHSLTRCRFPDAAALEGAGRPPARPLAAVELRSSASGADLRPARAEAREVAGRAPPPRPDPRRGTEPDRARPRAARALPPGAACERPGRGARPVPRALLDWKAAWLPSDTSTWAGFRSAGAPRSSSRR